METGLEGRRKEVRRPGRRRSWYYPEALGCGQGLEVEKGGETWFSAFLFFLSLIPSAISSSVQTLSAAHCQMA